MIVFMTNPASNARATRVHTPLLGFNARKLTKYGA